MTCVMGISRVKLMYTHVNGKNGEPAPLIAKDVFEVVMKVKVLSSRPLFFMVKCVPLNMQFIWCDWHRMLSAWTAKLSTTVTLTMITLASRCLLLAPTPKFQSQPCLHTSNMDSRTAQTLERSYLLRINGRVVERPQHMLMRVAVGIHKQAGPCALLCSEMRCAMVVHECSSVMASRMSLRLCRPTITCQRGGSLMHHLPSSMPARLARSYRPASWWL